MLLQGSHLRPPSKEVEKVYYRPSSHPPQTKKVAVTRILSTPTNNNGARLIGSAKSGTNSLLTNFIPGTFAKGLVRRNEMPQVRGIN